MNKDIERINAELATLNDQGVDIGETNDGFHSFNQLYDHRGKLFAAVCNANPSLAWKSKQHADGSMFSGGWFVCGINLPGGQATYHYKLSPYWDYFQVPELERAPEWDGHTPDQAVQRILDWSLGVRQAAKK